MNAENGIRFRDGGTADTNGSDRFISRMSPATSKAALVQASTSAAYTGRAANTGALLLTNARSLCHYAVTTGIKLATTSATILYDIIPAILKAWGCYKEIQKSQSLAQSQQRFIQDINKRWDANQSAYKQDPHNTAISGKTGHVCANLMKQVLESDLNGFQIHNLFSQWEIQLVSGQRWFEAEWLRTLFEEKTTQNPNDFDAKYKSLKEDIQKWNYSLSSTASEDERWIDQNRDLLRLIISNDQISSNDLHKMLIAMEVSPRDDLFWDSDGELHDVFADKHPKLSEVYFFSYLENIKKPLSALAVGFLWLVGISFCRWLFS